MKALNIQGLVAKETMRKFQAWSGQHRDRGCGDVQYSAAGLLMGSCTCVCPDHRCAEIVQEKRGLVTYCAICRDTGYVKGPDEREHPEFGRARRCPDCNGPGTPQRIEYLRLSSGVPLAMWAHCRIDLLHPDSQPRRGVQLWLDEWRKSRPFLVLSGPPGSGKTHAAVAVADYLLRHEDMTVAYEVVPALLDSLRRAYARRTAPEGAPGPDPDAVMRAYLAAQITVLDDLGQQRDTDFARESLFRIVNHRYERRMLTVITTNMASRDVPKMPEDQRPLWSRVFAAQVSYVAGTGRTDHRLAADDVVRSAPA